MEGLEGLYSAHSGCKMTTLTYTGRLHRSRRSFASPRNRTKQTEDGVRKRLCDECILSSAVRIIQTKRKQKAGQRGTRGTARLMHDGVRDLFRHAKWRQKGNKQIIWSRSTGLGWSGTYFFDLEKGWSRQMLLMWLERWWKRYISKSGWRNRRRKSFTESSLGKQYKQPAFPWIGLNSVREFWRLEAAGRRYWLQSP